MPPTRPIYFSVDGDTRNFTATQWVPVDVFFAEILSWIPLTRVGGYGGKTTIEHLMAKRLITWGWQTYAWSGTPTQWVPGVHLRQLSNNHDVCGAAVDYDQAMTRDYGQW